VEYVQAVVCSILKGLVEERGAVSDADVLVLEEWPLFDTEPPSSKSNGSYEEPAANVSQAAGSPVLSPR
jgi:hypothetical protein